MWIVTFPLYLLLSLSRILSSIVFKILHYSFTFTYRLTFPRLLLLFIILVTVGTYWFKIKYLNKYTELKEKPLEKGEGFDLHPDAVGGEEWRGGVEGLRGYLDEFREFSSLCCFGGNRCETKVTCPNKMCSSRRMARAQLMLP
ncbi:hypothetical protein BT69DRAFT_19277 [Atractiella rhizophila]|nr:hypothetical protein BT69DRAFT_19277 [Atractiella rhizophila]